ncbi:Pleckstrin y domain-containing family A member 7 [Portunus trituberculatus]|uniref:Pleckstrin y domain-containing family A member 7 n=1 Tax=Portunus trituberculatus TaxID=210409 RepID=A0A5B7DAQ8_PORTR|nr:Pleckstrin y domain-containing family A member 7 [Portunus trituberculatus]
MRKDVFPIAKISRCVRYPQHACTSYTARRGQQIWLRCDRYIINLENPRHERSVQEAKQGGGEARRGVQGSGYEGGGEELQEKVYEETFCTSNAAGCPGAVQYIYHFHFERPKATSSAAPVLTWCLRRSRGPWEWRDQAAGRRRGGSWVKTPGARRPEVAPVTLQGWLYKQGADGLHLWKKRWFVLSEYCLYYYKVWDVRYTLLTVRF